MLLYLPLVALYVTVSSLGRSDRVPVVMGATIARQDLLSGTVCSN